MLYRIVVELDCIEPVTEDILKEFVAFLKEKNTPVQFMSVERIKDKGELS
mgnify:CR=1 FL=1